jgi:hypothetical protein
LPACNIHLLQLNLWLQWALCFATQQRKS